MERCHPGSLSVAIVSLSALFFCVFSVHLPCYICPRLIVDLHDDARVPFHSVVVPCPRA